MLGEKLSWDIYPSPSPGQDTYPARSQAALWKLGFVVRHEAKAECRLTLLRFTA